MPVEIRELVIKTTLESRQTGNKTASPSPAAMQALRQDILEHCERLIRDYQTRKNLDR